MNYSQFIRARNTGMLPSGFIKPITNKTTSDVRYVSPSKDTTIGQYMSTFYPRRITYKGITYPTVEHAYQAQKFFYSDCPIITKKFRYGGSITCPRKAREMGSEEGLEDIGVHLDDRWEANKHRVFSEIITKRKQQDQLFNAYFTPENA